jgi:2-dehydro-3-deoxygalactonokinase
LGRLLFSVRALGLFGELGAESAADYLSGLLIGSELASALTSDDAGVTPALALVGEATLCERYGRAMGAWGRPSERFEQPLAAAGLWQVGRAAGLC